MPELITVHTVGSRRSVGVLASLSFADPMWNRPCQKLTVFSPGANSSATLPGSGIAAATIVPDERDGCGRCDADDVFRIAGLRPRGGGLAGLTQRNLVSTLEQSPARGDTAATGPFGTAPASFARPIELTNGRLRHVRHEDSCRAGVGARLNKE